MKKIIAVAFLFVLAILIVIAYDYIPTWIMENRVYNILINGSILVGFVFLILQGVKIGG